MTFFSTAHLLEIVLGAYPLGERPQLAVTDELVVGEVQGYQPRHGGKGQGGEGGQRVVREAGGKMHYFYYFLFIIIYLFTLFLFMKNLMDRVKEGQGVKGG